MQEKTGITEGLGYFIAFSTLLAAVKVTGWINDPDTADPKQIPLFFSLWAETVLMFVGLTKMNPVCMKVVKWLNIAKCSICMLALLKVGYHLAQEHINSSVLSALLFFPTVGMGLTVFVAYVAHCLDKIYTNLLRNRHQQLVLITEIVHEGPVSTPPAQKRLHSVSTATLTSTSESEKSKELPSWV